MASIIHCCLEEASGYLLHITVEEVRERSVEGGDKIFRKSSWGYLSKL